MTNEELIAKIIKENYEMKAYLCHIDESARNILGILYCIGGGLNDNIKQYSKEQMVDLIKIAELANDIRHLSSDVEILHEN